MLDNLDIKFPPRAEFKILPERLVNFENDGFIGQPKMNGDCCLARINGSEQQIDNRYDGALTKIDESINFNELHAGTGTMILAGEYMSKSKKNANGELFNHRFVIWDLLAIDGKSLVGCDLDERLNILYSINYDYTDYDPYINKISDTFYAVKSFSKDFLQLYNRIIPIDMYEGLVLKKRTGKLELLTSPKNNTRWQIKARKPSNSYKI